MPSNTHTPVSHYLSCICLCLSPVSHLCPLSPLVCLHLSLVCLSLSLTSLLLSPSFLISPSSVSFPQLSLSLSLPGLSLSRLSGPGTARTQPVAHILERVCNRWRLWRLRLPLPAAPLPAQGPEPTQRAQTAGHCGAAHSGETGGREPSGGH